ncbi:MAG: tRNA lysidine(34) synthetase TilS [Desulfuromonadales bacterium]
MSLPMQEIVGRLLLEHSLLRPEDRVLVAVSGGPDSVCLLHLLWQLAPALGVTVCAAHLDHLLRPESGREASFVQDLCAQWDIPLTLRAADVAQTARRRHSGIEETAREVRRDFLREVATRQDCRVIALGHHRGDQAETVLHRFLRGSGGTGLAGMRLANLPFIRPLLEVTRRQILDYLRQNQLPWVEDSSNQDRAFTRNRLRNEILPLLKEFNPRLEENLARSARRMAIEDDFWREQSESALSSLAAFSGENCHLDCGRLLQLHPAFRTRILRQALFRVRGDLHRLSAVHFENIENLLLRKRSQADLHLPGAWIGRRYNRLWLRRSPPPETPDVSLVIEGPGEFTIPRIGRLWVAIEPAALGEGRQTVEFDPAVVKFPLRLRQFRPGDRFRPDGLGGHKKVKDFFVDMKLDRESRRRVLLLEGDEVFWLVGMRRCEGLRPAPGAAALRVQFQPAAE